MGSGFIVEVSTPTPLNIQQLVINFLRAVERFRAQATHASPSEARPQTQSLGHAALAEALNWADSIDQYLGKGPRGTKGTQRDPSWASQLGRDQQQIIHAFQRVRNLVHHQWWQAIAVSMDTSTGVQHNDWVWAPLGKSAGIGRVKDDAGDMAYAAALKGHSVLDTLDALAEIFWTRRTWVITQHDLIQPGHDIGTLIMLDGDAPAESRPN